MESQGYCKTVCGVRSGLQIGSLFYVTSTWAVIVTERPCFGSLGPLVVYLWGPGSYIHEGRRYARLRLNSGYSHSIRDLIPLYLGSWTHWVLYDPEADGCGLEERSWAPGHRHSPAGRQRRQTHLKHLPRGFKMEVYCRWLAIMHMSSGQWCW